MSGTRELPPPPTQLPSGRVPDPAEVAPTQATDSDPVGDLHARAAKLGVLPAILKADDDARHAATLTVRGTLPMSEQARIRALTLLASLPQSTARRELEAMIRGGDVGDGSVTAMISPVSSTVASSK